MQKKFIIFCCLQKRCDNPSLDTQNRISEFPSFSRSFSYLLLPLVSHEPQASLSDLTFLIHKHLCVSVLLCPLWGNYPACSLAPMMQRSTPTDV